MIGAENPSGSISPHRVADPVAKEAFPKTVVQQTRGGELDIKIAHKTLWTALCLNGLGALLVRLLGRYESLDFNKPSRCSRRVPNRIFFRNPICIVSVCETKFDGGNVRARYALGVKHADAWPACHDIRKESL